MTKISSIIRFGTISERGVLYAAIILVDSILITLAGILTDVAVRILPTKPKLLLLADKTTTNKLVGLSLPLPLISRQKQPIKLSQ